MVKIQDRSTSASLETGFSLFSKMTVIFDPFFLLFVLSTRLHLAHTRVEGLDRTRGAGTPTSPPAQRAALAVTGKRPLSCAAGGFGGCRCSALLSTGDPQRSYPPNSACPPRLQPARRNLLLPRHRLLQARHCSAAPAPEPRERSRPPCRSSSTAVKKELK